ncbi:MAG: DUF1697 domain-containing protein [Ktedonobacteraceae bacterium]
MTTYVALFRGINVGGHNKIRMAELKGVHEALGLRAVVPYIQSGNVVFKSDDTTDTTDAADGARIRAQIEASVEERFGFHVEVMVRTLDELRAIIAHNPFQGQPNKEIKWIVVLFLAAQPTAAAQEDLLTSYTGPEEIFIHGREAYIYYPDGIGRSKLTNALLERKLKSAATARNWNTILQLHELMQH